jgi:hypothetical protein
MDARILILTTLRRRTQTELHLSTLNGLQVIPATERDFGNVFQSTIRGRWESPGVFHCVTGERLIVDADGRARWGADDGQGLKPFRWGIRDAGRSGTPTDQAP